MAKTQGYKIESLTGIQNLSRVLLTKLREATESGKDLVVYVCLKQVRKEVKPDKVIAVRQAHG